MSTAEETRDAAITALVAKLAELEAQLIKRAKAYDEMIDDRDRVVDLLTTANGTLARLSEPSTMAWIVPVGTVAVTPTVFQSAREIIVTGSPHPTDDNTDPRYHNCDTMGCGRDHVVARLPILTDALRAELAAANGTLARLTERLRELPLYDYESDGGGSMHNRCGLLTLVPEGHRQYSDGSEFVRWSDILAAVAQASAPTEEPT